MEDKITNTRKMGSWGEDLAVEFLIQQGYSIRKRNYRTRHGEIDIIAVKNGILVFVEVKTRRSTAYANPEEAVTTRKQAHILAAAEQFIEQQESVEDAWQVDVIAIDGCPNGKTHIEHFENVLG